jgi:hypothetical protein
MLNEQKLSSPIAKTIYQRRGVENVHKLQAGVRIGADACALSR